MSISYTAEKVMSQWNLPNTLSFSRVLLGFTVFFWWQFDSILTIALLTLAAVTDGLDGWTARQFNQRTPLGVQLDPIADKLFVLPVLWYVAVITMRPELFVLAIVTTLYDIDNTRQRWTAISVALKGYELQSDTKKVTLISKGKTALQFVLLGTLVFPVLSSVALVFALTSLVLVLISWEKNRRTWWRHRLRRD